ncbi:hypothetical protein EG329_011588 [Mollisiaceae sp. DMI_Dod_QoI]|nr:hypothetical protein EG329_011588 [Helotiales sp. DMI_Dod_QoI]
MAEYPDYYPVFSTFGGLIINTPPYSYNPSELDEDEVFDHPWREFDPDSDVEDVATPGPASAPQPCYQTEAIDLAEHSEDLGAEAFDHLPEPRLQPSIESCIDFPISHRGLMMSNPELFYGSKFELFDKFPLEIRIMIFLITFVPRFIELRFSVNSRSTQFDCVADIILVALNVCRKWREEILGNTAVMRMFDHKQCKLATYFNPLLDTFHISHHSTMWQLSKIIRGLPDIEKVEKLSIDGDHLWFENGRRGFPRFDMDMASPFKPLLFQFMNLKEVRVSHQVLNGYLEQPGWHIGPCNKVSAGSRHCIPPTNENGFFSSNRGYNAISTLHNAVKKFVEELEAAREAEKASGVKPSEWKQPTFTCGYLCVDEIPGQAFCSYTDIKSAPLERERRDRKAKTKALMDTDDQYTRSGTERASDIIMGIKISGKK